MSKKCLNCKKYLPLDLPRYETRIYCNGKCRKENEYKRYLVNNPGNGVSTGTLGAMQEILVSYDLLKKGYEVFRAISPASSCDLLIVNNKRTVRVEVTTGYISNAGKIIVPKKDVEKLDVLAVVVKQKIHYIPEDF